MDTVIDQPERVYKTAEIGRERSMGKMLTPSFVPQQRFMRQWDNLITEVYVPFQKQIGFTEEHLERFYEGWVKPLSTIGTEHCGHKVSAVASRHQLTMFNLPDILDLAINTTAIPYIFPGSSLDHYETGTQIDVQCNIHCTHKYNVLTHHSDLEVVGRKMLIDGDISRFTLSIMGLERFKKYSGIVNGENETYFKEALIRIHRLHDSWHTNAITSFTRRGNYTEISTDDYKGLVQSVGESNAMFFAMMALLRTWKLDDFNPSKNEIQLFDDDVFMGRMIQMMHSLPISQSYSQDTRVPLTTIIKSIKHGIDISLMTSVIREY